LESGSVGSAAAIAAATAALPSAGALWADLSSYVTTELGTLFGSSTATDLLSGLTGLF
jgi:hypothetical protein